MPLVLYTCMGVVEQFCVLIIFCGLQEDYEKHKNKTALNLLAILYDMYMYSICMSFVF